MYQKIYKLRYDSRLISIINKGDQQMDTQTLQTNIASLKGTISIPGDKSISHRSIMFGALAEGVTKIENFLPGADCISTIDCFSKLGVSIQQNGDRVEVIGKGFSGLKAPS